MYMVAIKTVTAYFYPLSKKKIVFVNHPKIVHREHRRMH